VVAYEEKKFEVACGMSASPADLGYLRFLRYRSRSCMEMGRSDLAQMSLVEHRKIAEDANLLVEMASWILHVRRDWRKAEEMLSAAQKWPGEKDVDFRRAWTTAQGLCSEVKQKKRDRGE
jgi:hypothetical protein